MTFYYTARGMFGEIHEEYGLEWENYGAWRDNRARSEIISLDGLLNRNLIKDDRSHEYWGAVLSGELNKYDLFQSLAYVRNRTAHLPRFNLLAVVVEPVEDCKAVWLPDFEFVGYDLMDVEGNISSLTNCDGFDLSYGPEDKNQYGLLAEFEKAYDAKTKLLENNPDHPHADTLVMALWRHKTIGRGEKEVAR